MKLRVFLVFTFLFNLTLVSNSFARKPAVEDFVGVESEDYKATSQGTEVLFNFGNHIDSHQKIAKMNDQSSQWFTVITLMAFMTLPFFMWYGITRSVDKHTSLDDQEHQVQKNVDSNVKHLSDYKSENDDSSIKDDIKKVG